MPKLGANRLAEPLEQAGRTEILWRGRELAYFGGCDYFRLSSAPSVLRAVRSALGKAGLNVAASRKTTGNHPLYERLETEIARFFGAESACLASSGYITNIVAAQALRGFFDKVCLHEKAHPSLRDAARFLDCPIASMAELRKPAGRVAAMTDGMFAHSGAFAPIEDYRSGASERVWLWVDDSHAAGVIGPKGRGSFEAAGISRRATIQTVTFSKAFGVYGGAILCDRQTAGRIVERSSAMAGNTPLPLPLAAGVLESLRWVSKHPELRDKLWRNVETFWDDSGINPPERLAPIVSFTTPHPAKLRRALLGNRVFPSQICYPGGPPEGYFRFAISSAHSPKQIRALARAVAGSDVAPLR